MGLLETDLAAADRLAAHFIASLGSDLRLREASYAISQAGGAPRDFDAALKNTLRGGETGLDRPWFWLAEILDHPAAAERPELVARIAVVVLVWHNDMRGRVGMADVSDMMLEPPPIGLVTRMLSVAVRLLRHADASLVLQDDITVGSTLSSCCRYIAGATTASDDVRQIARHFLS
ncbi:hypothetical protein [Actinoplanes sp. NPDC026619]|uniref:hypothetical protein n=1 Tax=Actinoplanes sp. NPDC026619 TaxID=3155798 RepID=UPI0033F053B7